jgi:hypothetical protein
MKAAKLLPELHDAGYKGGDAGALLTLGQQM